MIHCVICRYVMLFHEDAFVCLFCCFTSQVNSYGHCRTILRMLHIVNVGMLLHVEITCCFMRILLHGITCIDSMLLHEDDTCFYM